MLSFWCHLCDFDCFLDSFLPPPARGVSGGSAHSRPRKSPKSSAAASTSSVGNQEGIYTVDGPNPGAGLCVGLGLKESLFSSWASCPKNMNHLPKGAGHTRRSSVGEGQGKTSWELQKPVDSLATEDLELGKRGSPCVAGKAGHAAHVKKREMCLHLLEQSLPIIPVRPRQV